MAQIVTITNPLTGQPAQVDQLEHTAQQIDDAVAASTVESTDYPGCYYRTDSGVVEWVNPPMQINVEYRTTERYLGKPVYVKLVDCGLSANGLKTISVGAENLQLIIDVTGTLNNIATLPSISSFTEMGNKWNAWISAALGEVKIWCGSSEANKQCYACVKYTKTTD